MTNSVHASIETCLAAAHRALWNAAIHAESLKDQGLADDLHDLATEVRRLMEAQLRRGRPRPLYSPRTGDQT